MRKVINVEGKGVAFQCSALLPRIYRRAVGRDLMVDIQTLQESFTKVMDKGNKSKKNFDAIDLEIFENIAWAMAYHAYESELKEINSISDHEEREKRMAALEAVPTTPDEWLETIPGTFSIYEILPEILTLWGTSSKTTSKPAKK